MNLDSFIPVSTFNDSIAKFTQEQQIEFNYYEIVGSISRSLVEYRVKHHLNQKQLSELLGVSQSMVSKYESGDYNISIRALNDLCGKLGFSLEVKMSESRTPTNRQSPVASDFGAVDEVSLGAA